MDKPKIHRITITPPPSNLMLEGHRYSIAIKQVAVLLTRAFHFEGNGDANKRYRLRLHQEGQNQAIAKDMDAVDDKKAEMTIMSMLDSLPDSLHGGRFEMLLETLDEKGVSEKLVLNDVWLTLSGVVVGELPRRPVRNISDATRSAVGRNTMPEVPFAKKKS